MFQIDRDNLTLTKIHNLTSKHFLINHQQRKSLPL